MFIPNLPCIVGKKRKANLYGEAGVGATYPERCAIVKYKEESVHTTVRADSGATRSHADEFVTQNRILVAATTKAALDDRLEVIGFKIRIKAMRPRYNVVGQLDHYEIEGEEWG